MVSPFIVGKFITYQFARFFLDKKIMGIKVRSSSFNCVVLNVYGYCDYGTLDSLLDYKSFISILSNFLANEPYDDVIIAGDWNCDPNKGRFIHDYRQFASTHSLFMSDIDALPADTYTYVSQNSRATTSWLDHVLSSKLGLVRDIKVLYGSTFDDHIPVLFSVVIHDENLSPVVLPALETGNTIKVLWEKCSDHDIENYIVIISIRLRLTSGMKYCRVALQAAVELVI